VSLDIKRQSECLEQIGGYHQSTTTTPPPNFKKIKRQLKELDVKTLQQAYFAGTIQ